MLLTSGYSAVLAEEGAKGFALLAKPYSATTISEHLPVTRQAVAKHLTVLENAGLVTASTVGRERRFRVDEVRFARAVEQLTSVGSAWDARLRRIKTIAESIQRAAEEK